MSRHKENPLELDVDNVFFHGESGPPAPGSPTTSPARRCTPDQAGFYGTFAGDFRQIDYLYQVETIPGETPLNPDIISAVETKAIDTLLPVLFSQECIDTSVTRMGDLRRKLELLGLSTQPPDKVVPFVACEGLLADQDNNCFLVDGAMSVFGESDAELDDSVTVSREAIKGAMDAGDFNEIDDRIVKVTYLNKTLPVSGGSSQQGTNGDSDSGSNVPAYGWVFIALAPIVLGALIIAFMRRRRRQREDMGAFPVATSDQDVIPYEDPVLGITVKTPTPETGEQNEPSWAIIENRQLGEGQHSDDSLGSIGISPKPMQPSNVDSIIAPGSTPGEPEKWERLSLT